jgi:hypothetical protein
VYHLIPSATGTMTIRLGFDLAGTTAECVVDGAALPCWDRVLHVRHTLGANGPAICASTDDISNANPALWIPPANQIACDYFGAAPGYTQQVSFPVIDGEHYYVFVGGFYVNPTYMHGPYYLHVDLQ